MSGAQRLGSKFFFFSAAVFLAAIACCSGKANADRGSGAEPVLLELFTSEGCSSCPPADRLAIQLQSQDKDGGQVIILSEHVDYWNYLGWQDRYSSPLFTERQHAYAQALGQNDVYTPEAIIDGKVGVVGNESQSIDKAIRQCASSAKAKLSVSTQNNPSNSTKQKVTVTAECPNNLSLEQGQLFVAVTEDNLKSNVRSGENGGAILAHTGVVRSLHKVSNTVSLSPDKPIKFDTEITLDPQWKKGDLRVVAFLQDPVKQRILGVNQRKILQ
jgi:hypothetical protein